MMVLDPQSRQLQIAMCEDALTSPRHVEDPNNADAVKLRARLAELAGTVAGLPAAQVDDGVTVGRRAGSATSNQYGTFTVHHATERQVAFLARLIAEKQPRPGMKIPSTLEGISKTMCSALIDQLINQPNKAGAPVVNPASDKQLNLIAKLASEKQLDEGLQMVIDVIAEKPETCSKSSASKIIDKLFALPRAVAAPAAPKNVWDEIAALAAQVPVDAEARHDSLSFALDNGDNEIKFYRLDRPTQGRWDGYIFLNAQASEEFYPIRNGAEIKRILTELIADMKGAVTLYGLSLEKCGHCGRKLTKKESRERGIGPVCASRMGW